MYAITWHLTNNDGFSEYGSWAGYNEDCGITPAYQDYRDTGKIKAVGQYNKTSTEMDDTVIFRTKDDWTAYSSELNDLTWKNCTCTITSEGEFASVDDHPQAAQLTKF